MSQAKQVPAAPVYGVRVSKMNMPETVAYLERAVAERTPHQVVTANPIIIMTGLNNPAYMDVLRSAELVVPDGTGLVWAAGYTGNPVKERVAGFDLLHELLRKGESYGWRIYLLGSTAEVIQETARRLQMQYPGIVIAGYRDGFFGAEQDEEVVAGIRESKADLLFVARGVDTQEPWIGKYKRELGVPVMMGVGGSFDVISGRARRAPKAFQKLRMEWLYRLLKEPSRFGRMLDLPKFVLKVVRERDKVAKG